MKPVQVIALRRCKHLLQRLHDRHLIIRSRRSRHALLRSHGHKRDQHQQAHTPRHHPSAHAFTSVGIFQSFVQSFSHVVPFVERHVRAVPSNHHAACAPERNPTSILRQAAHLPARHHGLHLPRLSRHAALAPHVHAHRHSHRRHLCLRQHDQQAAQGLQSRVPRRRLRRRRARPPRRRSRSS